MQNLEQTLEGIGLSTNEAKIYLAILELGKSGMTEIAQKSGVKRTTIYSYINPLLEKGYIKKIIFRKRTLFTAESPKRLSEVLQKKHNDFLKKLPFLEQVYKDNTPKPHLEFYEGKLGVKELYQKVWSSGEEVLSFFSPEKYFQYFDQEFDMLLCSLEEKAGGKTKNLLQNNEAGARHRDGLFTAPGKLLPKEISLEVDTLIVKNSIIMVSYEPMQGILIKNKAFADFLRNLHNYFWKIL